ncbi:hypothetical protein [Idiomarina loihiensis]|uniref:hypothetical protein n=1 Tax=Idiomarina loihiensis TaxID=135577 RepID=UPI0031586934
MSYSQELLAEFMEKTGRNISETAEYLEMLQPNVSKVKKGDKRFSNDQLVRIAEALEIRPEIVLIKSNMDKSKSAKEREAWVKLLTSTAASLVMMITPVMMIAYNVYYVKL